MVRIVSAVDCCIARESDVWITEWLKCCARMLVQRVLVLHLLLRQRKSRRETKIQVIDRYDTIAVLGEMLLML